MWVNRKELEEMKQATNETKRDIKRVEEQIYYLNRIHKTHDFIDLFSVAVEHEDVMVNTSKVKNVTLEELARYILDNKPIERTEEVTKYYTKEDSNGEKHCNGCCH